MYSGDNPRAKKAENYSRDTFPIGLYVPSGKPAVILAAAILRIDVEALMLGPISLNRKREVNCNSNARSTIAAMSPREMSALGRYVLSG